MTKRGLGILGFAQVTAGVSDARFLFAVQTMPLSTKGRTPQYLEHMKENRDNQTGKCLRAISDHKEQLLDISDILVVTACSRAITSSQEPSGLDSMS